MSSSTTLPARRDTRLHGPVADALGIAVLAFVLRFGIVLFSNGGPRGMYGYDAGVYYSAADALTFGRVPYRDFIFLHPPGLMLVLTPFAALGRLTTDHTGYIVANLFFDLLAALNAVLVWTIARRWGLGRRSALFGGLFYAVWWGGINAEIGIRLEPLGTFAFLAAMLLLAGRESPGRGRAVAAGALLGGACCVKIWWVVPVLVVLAWYLLHRPLRRAGALLAAGGIGAGVLVAGPFLALAGDEMWHRVVSDQLGRKYHTQPYVRIQYLAGLRKGLPFLPTPVVALVVVVIGAVFVAAIVVAWRHPAARLAVAVLVAQFLVLNVSPSFFNFYSAFVAGPLALTMAAAMEPTAGRGRRTERLDHRVGLAAAAIAAVVTLGALANSRDLVDPFPGQRFERASVGLRCVMADSNSALILMNRLSSDLANGCPNWVDVTGHTYFGAAKSDDLTRAQNPGWQRLIRRYLLSGDAVVYVRKGTGLSRRTKRLIRSHPPLARGDGYVLRRVTSAP